MKDPRRRLTTENAEDDLTSNLAKTLTYCPPHFPQYHYFWEDNSLGAHCAKCGTDYIIPKENYKIINEPISIQNKED